jgi:hypothetical protein
MLVKQKENRKERSNMSERPIKFKYQKGIVTGGYSFSVKNNIITLSEYVEKLDPAIREAIQYEAKTARSFYIDEVNRLKANGEKVRTCRIKYEAVKRAKEEAEGKYADIWCDVEDIYNSQPLLSEETTTGNAESNNPNIIIQKGVKFIVVAADSDNLFNKLIETIENYNEATPKA